MGYRFKTSTLLLAFLAFAAFWSASLGQTTTTTESGCDVCANSGDCSKAYLGAPGQFCGPWLDTASQRHNCCCPRESTCDRGTYTCNCKKLSTTPTPTTKKPTPAPTESSSSSNKKKIIIIVVAVIIVLLLLGAAYYFWSQNNRERSSSVEIKETVYVQEQPVVYQQGGYAQQGYAPSGYPAQQTYEVHHYHNSPRGGGGMSTGAGIAVGAAAGLVGGMLIGEALADAGDHGDNGNYGGGYGGGGGGDEDTFAGDF
uniref:EGF-like domain-containing protein n=1 Tax=Globisporangium ultimum (strain ATCC 200006 / CBS 805.95 / DAOM BR144) TaxID=431595 RepID=K3X1B8_GLOUD